jgi:cytochrome c6
MASNLSEQRSNSEASARWALRVVAAIFFGLLGTTLLFPASSQAADEADNSAGQASYKTKCLACHGADGTGTPVGKSLKAANLRSPEVQKKSGPELAQVISDGKGNMPSFRSSTKEDEIQALVKYVRTFGAK